MAELDKRRRDVHNLALNSVLGMNMLAEKKKWPKIYNGKTVSEDELKNHRSQQSYDAIYEMTDFFLKFLNDIEEQSIENIEKEMTKVEVKKLQDKLYGIKRDYKVKQGLMHDDGDIEFEDIR